MLKLIRFLTRDYPAMVEYKPSSVQQTFQVERHPFATLDVYQNGILLTGTVSDAETGVVTLASAPAQGSILLVRYTPVWFTDEEIKRMAVIEWADERLYERESGIYAFAHFKAPLMGAVTIEGSEIDDTGYNATTNTYALPSGKQPHYVGTVCNVYATAAYLYTVMASDPDRIRANYASRINDIPMITKSFRDQSEQLFKLGGQHFD